MSVTTTAILANGVVKKPPPPTYLKEKGDSKADGESFHTLIEPGFLLPNVPTQLCHAKRYAWNSPSLRQLLCDSNQHIDPAAFVTSHNSLYGGPDGDDPTDHDDEPNGVRRFPIKPVVVGDLEIRLPKGYKIKQHDVICEPQGVRDRCIYPGNERFRVLVDLYVTRYAHAQGRLGKIEIIKEIISAVYGAGGNFIRQALEHRELDDGITVAPGEFTDIGEFKAREKVGHALRNYLMKCKKAGHYLDDDEKEKVEADVAASSGLPIPKPKVKKPTEGDGTPTEPVPSKRGPPKRLIINPRKFSELEPASIVLNPKKQVEFPSFEDAMKRALDVYTAKQQVLLANGGARPAQGSKPKRPPTANANPTRRPSMALAANKSMGTAGPNSNRRPSMVGPKSNRRPSMGGPNSNIPPGMVGTNANIPSGMAGANVNTPRGMTGTNPNTQSGMAGPNTARGMMGPSSNRRPSMAGSTMGMAGLNSNRPMLGTNANTPQGMAGLNSNRPMLGTNANTPHGMNSSMPPPGPNPRPPEFQSNNNPTLRQLQSLASIEPARAHYYPQAQNDLASRAKNEAAFAQRFPVAQQERAGRAGMEPSLELLYQKEQHELAAQALAYHFHQEQQERASRASIDPAMVFQYQNEQHERASRARAPLGTAGSGPLQQQSIPEMHARIQPTSGQSATTHTAIPAVQTRMGPAPISVNPTRKLTHPSLPPASSIPGPKKPRALNSLHSSLQSAMSSPKKPKAHPSLLASIEPSPTKKRKSPFSAFQPASFAKLPRAMPRGANPPTPTSNECTSPSRSAIRGKVAANQEFHRSVPEPPFDTRHEEAMLIVDDESNRCEPTASSRVSARTMTRAGGNGQSLRKKQVAPLRSQWVTASAERSDVSAPVVEGGAWTLRKKEGSGPSVATTRLEVTRVLNLDENEAMLGSVLLQLRNGR